MFKRDSPVLAHILIFFFFFAVILIFTILRLPFRFLFILILAAIVFLISFINTNFALIILIFSMLLSPEIPVFKVPDRAVVVRIDDILLIVIFLSWLAKTALNKGFGFLKNTPVNKPLIIYAVLCIIVTALAIILGIGQAKFSNAFFYILKYLEYFVIFFLVNNNIRDLKQIKVFTVLMLIVCFIIVLYGYWQMRTGAYRLSAPFEGEKPEPNTLAGYLILMFGIMGGLFLHSRSLTMKLIIAGLFLFTMPVFLLTLSRGGYLAFLMLYFCFIIFSRKAKFFLITAFFVFALILPKMLPLSVIERVNKTFHPDITVGKQRYEIGGESFAVEESAAARLEVLKWVIPLWLKSPLFGYGVTGVGFVEGQYTRILAELGILGILAFFWIISRLFINFLRIYRSSDDDWVEGICLGLIASLFAFLIHGTGANIFIIVRVMEPFWFLTAMVLAVPYIKRDISIADIG